MSLTALIQASSGKHYQSKSGTVYLLQKVRGFEVLLEGGNLPDLLKMQPKDGVAIDPIALMQSDPESASRALQAAMMTPRRTLEKGLLGEMLPNGSALMYRWCDKNIYDLEEGEVNASLLPEELRTELLEQIELLSADPVTPEVAQRFPQQ